MFQWANREPLAARTPSNAKSQHADRSYPSSPAHSTNSFDTRAHTDLSHKKRIILRSKKKSPRKVMLTPQDHDWRSSSKSDLLRLMGQRKDKTRMKPEHQSEQCEIQCNNKKKARENVSSWGIGEPGEKAKGEGCGARNWLEQAKERKSTIKILLPTNSLLPEFVHCWVEVRAKPWGIFSMGTILLNLGFISDLVQDRSSIKNIWEELSFPDCLALYIFVQRIMGGKVNIPSAASALNIQDTSLADKWNQHIQITGVTLTLMQGMRANRITRKRSHFGEERE